MPLHKDSIILYTIINKQNFLYINRKTPYFRIIYRQYKAMVF